MLTNYEGREPLGEKHRRIAAAKTAGSIVVAAAFGVRVKATLCERKNIDMSVDMLEVNLAQVSEVPEEARLPVAFAWTVAEVLQDNPDAEAFDIGRLLSDGLIELPAADSGLLGLQCSPSDREEGCQEVPIQEAIDAIRSNQPLFDWCVAELMSEGVVTDCMVAEWIEKNGITRVDIDDDAAAA